MQRLHPTNADKGLHGVVCEHATATANTGASVECDVMAELFIRVPSDLIRTDDIQRVPRLWVFARVDGAV